MSLKSILKKIFHIQNDGVYRMFRILGVRCKYKSPKLRLLRKIDFVSKQNDTALESRLRKEIEVKIKTLADIKEKLRKDFEKKLNESENNSERKIEEAKNNFDKQINSLKIESEKQLNEFKSQIKKLTEENSKVKNDLETKTATLNDANEKLKNTVTANLKVLEEFKKASETRLKNLETKLKCENEMLKRKATLHRMYNVQELFLQQNSKNYKSPYSFNRFDTVVRYLAIENYFGKNDFGFDFYSRMQAKRCEPESVPERVENFKKLIESWNQNGYQSDSEITLDSKLHLVDGSHRFACALYFGQDSISAKILNSDMGIEYNATDFIEYDFTKEEIEKIAAAAERILTGWHENYISVILWPPVARYFDEITEKLELLYEISDIEDFEYNDVIFERLVKGVYCVDDIADWKIEKKLEYMKEHNPKKVRVMRVHVPYPEFRIKAATGNTLSVEGERIKKMIRNCYKGKVENYFHDIIIHTGDNFLQSRFITRLFHPYIPLKEYFDSIKDFSWMLIKSENEYTPENFPEEFPFSKDADIVVAKDEYEAFIEATKNFFEENKLDEYEVRVIKNGDNCHIRIEQIFKSDGCNLSDRFLIYQIDVSRSIGDGGGYDFINESLSRRVVKKNYFVPETQDEIVFRAREFIAFPQKVRHLNYLKTHSVFWDTQKIIAALPSHEKEILKLYKEIQNDDESAILPKEVYP